MYKMNVSREIEKRILGALILRNIIIIIIEQVDKVTMQLNYAIR